MEDPSDRATWKWGFEKRNQTEEENDKDCDAMSIDMNLPSTPRVDPVDDLTLDLMAPLTKLPGVTPKTGTSINGGFSLYWPSSRSQPSTMLTESSDELVCFADTQDFTLTINTIDYPIWAINEKRPLPYFPVPLKALPDIPAIPAKLEISFAQIMDVECFKDIIDGLLRNNGYTFSHTAIERIWVSYTHKNGKRERLAVSTECLPLITRPWAKDVWLGHLDGVAGYCLCQECKNGQRLGHGLVVDIAFPQGFEKQRKISSASIAKETSNLADYWSGKRKLPYHDRGRDVPTAVKYATDVRRVRFQ